MKRGLLSIAMLLALPTFASAAFNCWSVTRSVSSGITDKTLTAQIDARNATLQAPPDGGFYKTVGNVTYVQVAVGTDCAKPTTPTTIPFTLTPPAGLAPVVTIDGVKQTGENAPVAGMSKVYEIAKGTKLSHSINAAYAPTATMVSITTVGVAGGYIEASQKIPYGTGTDISITPSAGYTIASVKVGNDALSAVAIDAEALDAVKAAGYYSFSNLTTNKYVTATFAQTPTLSASIATANAILTVDQELNLRGAALANMSTIVPTYAWTVTKDGVAANSAIVSGATAANAVFKAAAAGTYVVTLTVADAAKNLSDTEVRTITVQTTAAAESKTCGSCHGVRDAALNTSYAASLHANNPYHLVSCADCHNPSGVASHPFALSAAESACYPCHEKHLSANHAATPARDACATCHNPHTLAQVANTDGHFDGKAFHLAQYVSGATLPVTCADCHSASTTNQAIRAQYALSAHGATTSEAWLHFDWRSGSRSACARCHNGSAFVAKLGAETSTSNVFAVTDILKPGETLSCSACHTDAATGALRTASSTFTLNGADYDVPGASGLCVRCHSGRETGASITATTKILPAPHYGAAAGVLYNTGGYEYAGQEYDALGANKLLGADAEGPCVACHMSGGSHTFAAVGDATAKANFQTALDGLKAALEAKGIYYASTHPYFFKAAYNPDRGTDGLVPTNVPVTDWTLNNSYAKEGVMGAAFNYALLVNEPGAYAHNPEYALKLIQDSINFLAPVP